VLDEGATFVRYVALSFGFIGIMRAFTGGFRGAGKTLIAAAISILALGGVRLPVAWIASQYFLGISGVWLSFAVSNVVGAVVAWAWFRRGTWRDADVRGEGPPGPTGRDADDVDAAPTDD
jgi:Na+-driven multidrug efflux pump